MPFMFARERHFTELLIPAHLLADDSVRTRAVAVLTPEVCQDVEVIGWLYQFYISERKDEARQQAEAQKEADRLRKVLLELAEYEHDVLYPLASRQLAIDLDDGVKANNPKFGAALKKIAGLEATDE